MKSCCLYWVSGDNMIKIENLIKTFDDFVALDKLNVNVKKGAIYGLVGVNGSGKTTAIRHLCGVYKQDSGKVLIDGAPIYDNIEIKQRIGFVSDDLTFFDNSMRSLKNLYKDMYERWDEARFNKLVSLFGLNERGNLRKFSKGMQKQASFAFAMATTPDVLLLDEPIDGLDPIVRRLVIREMMDDVAERDMTVLVSSHNLKEMEGICDSIGIVKKGRMIVERDIDDLKSDVHKIQVAFGEDVPSGTEKYGDLNILHEEVRGSVELLVVRGKQEEIMSKIKTLKPHLYDILPLTLEEIFIYETDGEFNEIPY